VEALPAYRDLLVPLLRRGDAFSVVSERQRYSLIGQLGLAGRLNRATAGDELVSVVPCCAWAEGLEEGGEENVVGSPWSDDFVLLWGGGFNTWCDVETLVEGVTRARSEAPDLRLVVTGGAIEGHDETSYARFRRLVGASEYRDRFSVKGSVDSVEARRIQEWADVGLVTERRLYERELGSSGRIVEWLARGLPVVCTAQSEIGETVEREGLGFSYREGDAQDLARVILEARRDPVGRGEMTARSRTWAGVHLNLYTTAKPLTTWARSARSAGDRGRRNTLDVWRDVEEARSRVDELAKTLASERQAWIGERSHLEERYHAVRGELGEIHLSRMWKVWVSYQSVAGALKAPLRKRSAEGEERVGSEEHE
jgi:glycosyltransferase involved in cell wall biosynthesis